MEVNLTKAIHRLEPLFDPAVMNFLFDKNGQKVRGDMLANLNTFVVWGLSQCRLDGKLGPHVGYASRSVTTSAQNGTPLMTGAPLPVRIRRTGSGIRNPFGACGKLGVRSNAIKSKSDSEKGIWRLRMISPNLRALRAKGQLLTKYRLPSPQAMALGFLALVEKVVKSAELP